MAEYRNLYIHLPFCRSKCDYCAFYSQTGQEAQINGYLARLKQELDQLDLPLPLKTVYVGGGTPTLLNEEQLRFLSAMLPAADERSIESNPETLTPEKVAILADSFSRISMGVQSFSAEKRRILGRHCTDKAIFSALELLSSAHFKHRNIDLIYGIGGQTALEWQADLQQALQFPIDHLSCYALTLEENHRLQPNAQLSDHVEREADMAELTAAYLAAHQFKQYEISNYAKPDGECQHNLNVWHGEAYLGLGAAAASFNGQLRFTQVADLNAYLNHTPPELDQLPTAERVNEVFVMNLRTIQGWSPQLWQQTALPEKPAWQTMLNKVQSHAENYPECWHITPERIALSTYGLSFWDNIAVELL